MKILVTGANGFVGTSLVSELQQIGHTVTVANRVKHTISGQKVSEIVTGELSGQQNWLAALQSTDVVIHLAARVHVMNDKSLNPLDEFRKVNTEATLNLARQASIAGVKRFIFLSSIKVNGESTNNRSPFSDKEKCEPTDPYAISKWEAEQGLMELAHDLGIEVVIIRPPLVYGPGVKGNFASLLKWVKKGIPLPFGALLNRRSLLALDNLTGFIVCCLEHKKAANQVFVVSDEQDISSAELVLKLAHAQQVKARLISVPASVLIFSARITGRAMIAERLLGSLQVDTSKANELLGWKPDVSMDEQLKKMFND